MYDKIVTAYMESYLDVCVDVNEDEDEHEYCWLVAMGMHETLRIAGKLRTRGVLT